MAIRRRLVSRPVAENRPRTSVHAADPLVVVLDEPASALDAETEHALFDRYAQAAREDQRFHSGGITILVSHRFSTVHERVGHEMRRTPIRLRSDAAYRCRLPTPLTRQAFLLIQRPASARGASAGDPSSLRSLQHGCWDDREWAVFPQPGVVPSVHRRAWWRPVQGAGLPFVRFVTIPEGPRSMHTKWKRLGLPQRCTIAG